MSEYIVSARKYRPQTFDSVVGQEALTTTLKNTVKSGKIAHAYLFCGPRGVGKTTCARIFAKAINCLNPTADGEACNECESCQAFNEQRSFNIFELDAASNNSVNDIRELMAQTRIPPQVGKYKVFIIDEVHTLSKDAFNAFLKTLEEPPAHVIFILATTEKNKILPTILSRCQIYDFERMGVPDIISHLKKVAEKEGVTYEEQALSVIAEKADGGMRDALSIFDQATSFCQGNITYKKVISDLNVLDEDNYFSIVDLAFENKVSEVMVLLNTLIEKGFDGGNLINGMATHVRNVLMAKDEQTIKLLDASEQQAQRYKEQAQKCPAKFLYQALKILSQCDINYKMSSNKRLLVELTLIEVAQITQKDDDVPAAGRSPKHLKSLFKKLFISSQSTTVAPQVAGTGQSVASPKIHKTKAEKATIVAENTVKARAAVSTSPRIKLSSFGNTFASILKKDEEKSVEQEENIDNTEGEKRFSDDDLMLQWRMMCNRMPQKMTGIASRMKNMKPKITEYPNIEVVVDNQILLDQMEGISKRIRATMARGLHNGNIQVSFRLAKAEEVTKILTKREIFNKLYEENPAMKILTDNLNLELS